MPEFTYAGGRLIERDGAPFVTIGRVLEPRTGAGPDAVDVDAFSRTVPEALRALEMIARGCAHPAAIARDVLRLLDWRQPDPRA